MATGIIKDKFNVEIIIDRIQFNPFRSFSLHRVVFSDHRSDTLFYVHQLDFKLKELNIEKLRFGLTQVNLKGGYCKLITYEDSTSSLDILDNFLSDDTTASDGPPFHLYFDNLLLTESRFKLYDYTDNHEDTIGFDGLNEYFYDVVFDCNSFHIVLDSMYMDLRKMACRERSGFELTQMSCKAVLYDHGMYFDSLLVITPHSKFGNQFSMKYNGWKSLADFENNVWMNAHLTENSLVSFKDIAYFAPAVSSMDALVNIKGNMRGTLSSMRIRDVEASLGNHTVIAGSFNINGLPDLDNMYLDLQLSNMQTHASDLTAMFGTKMPDMLYNLGEIQYKGMLSGFINDFVSFGDVKTDAGNIYTDINLKMTDNADASYIGMLRTKQFDLGKVIGMQKYLGQMTLQINTKGKGFDFNTLTNEFTLQIDSFFANGYNYTAIHATGKLDKRNFTADLAMQDPNLDFDFKGTIDFSAKVPLYKFIAKLNYLDVKALNFDTIDMAVSAKFDIDFAYQDLDDNYGRIDIDKLLFIKEGKDYPIKHISLITSINDDNRNVKLIADDLEAGISGNVKIRELNKVFQSFVSYLFPAYYPESNPKSNPYNEANFLLYANVRDLSMYSNLFFPHYNLKNTNMQFAYNGKRHTLKADAKLGFLRINDFEFVDLIVKSEEPNEGQKTLLLNMGSLNLNDSTVLNNLSVRLATEKNLLHTSIRIKDSLDDIFARVQFESEFRAQSVYTYADQSDISLRGVRFSADRDGKIVINRNKLKIDDFVVLINGNQKLFLNGFSEFEGRNNVRADFENVDLSIINVLYRKLNFDLGGLANGVFVFKNNRETFNVNAFFNLDRISLDKDTLGDFTLNSNYNERQNRLMVYAKSLKGKVKSLEIGGYVGFGNDESPIDFSINFDPSPINVFQAFVKEDVTFYEGDISIRSKIEGTVKNPIINGAIKLDKVHARVEYLKTAYKFNTSIQFDDLSMNIYPTRITDENGSVAEFKGTITHTFFKNFNLNIQLNKMNKFMVLNTTAKDNDLFYGKAFASGNIFLNGPVDDISMGGRLKTENNTILYLPISTESEGGEVNFIHFVNKDTTVITNLTSRKNNLSGFSMALTIDVTPNAEFQMILDPVNDDKITANGLGTVKMELTKQGAFNMYGTVEITKGEYKLTAANFFTKRFLIDNGSKISWTGDPLGAQMNIAAIYKVRKTSVANIVNTATEEERRALNTQRIPVDCILKLDGNMLRPDIKFDIFFPQMEGIIGTNNVSTIENSLRMLRNNPDLMNEQVVSLLLFGQFVPLSGMQQANNQTNIASGINNTVSDIISNQANNLIGRIVPGLDFNVDIQAGQSGQQAMYVFSASKKFFDDRLEVQGSYDPQFFNNNFLTQYSLTRTGNIRARVFSRNTTTLDGVYNRNTTTQGIGLYYRKEFEQFADLLRIKNKQTN
jgi:hypothetical protein